MDGRARLAGAQRALLGLVDCLTPADAFGLVSFSDTAQVEVSAGPLAHKAAARRVIKALRPRGLTDLSSGLLSGIEEALRVTGDRGATLLLISDGPPTRASSTTSSWRTSPAMAIGTASRRPPSATA
ncbi:VWA domain-containing protein [Nonomuraea indica]|uniref:VWA domain-containing protein n=1 Tax=Nonomuraea indica TaxID=1581193 RepID=A0ABW8AGC9_9ACTN